MSVREYLDGIKRLFWGLGACSALVFLLLLPASVTARKLPWILDKSLYFAVGFVVLAVLTSIIAGMFRKPALNNKFE